MKRQQQQRWKNFGNVCIFDERTNTLLSTQKLYNRGTKFKIGKNEYTFGTWEYGVKKPIAKNIEAMRISQYQRCTVDTWLHNVDF